MRKSRFHLGVIVLLLLFVVLVATRSGAEDLHHNIMPKVALNTVTVTGNDNSAGNIIDTLGYGSVTFIFVTGTIADNTMTLTPWIEHCAASNCTDAAAASAAQLIGSIPTFSNIAGSNSVGSVGYNPAGYRYVRVGGLPSGNADSLTYTAICVLGHPQYAPVQ